MTLNLAETIRLASLLCTLSLAVPARAADAPASPPPIPIGLAAYPLPPKPSSAYRPEARRPTRLTWTWSVTKGAALMWVPIGFEGSFRMPYERACYGTGYYIYPHWVPGTPLSQPLRAWDAKIP